MISDADMLNHVYQAADMGRAGILDLLKLAEDSSFRQSLNQQLAEYETLMSQAGSMMRSRHIQREEASPMAKISSQMMTTVKSLGDRSPSHLAEMMIQGNTMGVTKSIKHLNDYQHGDSEIRHLAEKLLATEQANIDQMKTYL